MSCELDDAELILEVEMVSRLADSGKKTMKWGALKSGSTISARKAKARDVLPKQRFQSGDIAYDTKAASPCRVFVTASAPFSGGDHLKRDGWLEAARGEVRGERTRPISSFHHLTPW